MYTRQRPTKDLETKLTFQKHVQSIQPLRKDNDRQKNGQQNQRSEGTFIPYTFRKMQNIKQSDAHNTEHTNKSTSAICSGKRPSRRETGRDTRRPPETDRERFRATIHRLNCLRSLVVDRRALGGRTILHASCYYLGFMCCGRRIRGGEK